MHEGSQFEMAWRSHRRPALHQNTAQVERKQRDHATLRVDLGAMTLHMEQKQEKERAARERVETLEVPVSTQLHCITDLRCFVGYEPVVL